MADKQLPQTRAYRKWTEEDLRAEALKYSTRAEFKRNSPNAYGVATRRRILDKIGPHLALTNRHWKLDDLRAEAMKYSNRKQFQNGSKAAYAKALRLNLLDELCSHMEPRFIWTDEALAELASGYSSKTLFRKAHPTAYGAAHARGLIPKICSHMAKPFFEKDCLYIWRVRGTDIYKIGISSSQHVLWRIIEVSVKADIVADVVLYSTVITSPRKVEQEILQLGQPVEFDRPFNGHTEFRWMSPEELAQAVGIIASNSWLN